MEDLRAQFPVLERVAYLNAGTNGPVPARAFETAARSLREQLEQGRSSKAWFERQIERIDELRERAAGLLPPATLALIFAALDKAAPLIVERAFRELKRLARELEP